MFYPFLIILISINQNINFATLMENRLQNQQLIDQNKGFHRNAIQTLTSVIGPVDRNYHSVAIIGVQNSGKSTLLNHLFGTKFQVLKEISGTRTTRGIWISCDQKQNILVFDVEGNDSMDRIEQQDYQKMVATYSLVTANVLLINTWSKTLGQHHGSQYQTLKIILDICITQFKQQSPKTILFCLRDFNDQYQNQRQIRRKVVDDVNDIWRKLQKPKQYQIYNDKPQKFFTVEVSTLRKYKPQKPQKFVQDVAKLRQKFVNPKAEGYVFARQKIQFNLPIQDLPQLSQNSWNSIKENKKLNLPNQKEQLASFRCSTIQAEVQNQFQRELGSLTEGNLITDFGVLKQKYIQLFNKKTYHYGKAVADQKLQELSLIIDDMLKKTIAQKLDAKEKQILKQFEQEAQNYTQLTEVNLDEQISKVYEVKVDQFVQYIKNMNYQVVSRKERIEQLSKKMKDNIESLKKNMLKMNEERFQNQSSRSTRLLTSQLINNNFGLQFWDKARSSIDQKSRQLSENYRKSYKWITGQQLSALQYSDLQQKIKEQSKSFIKSELQKSFQGRILQQFKNKFTKDQNGHTINFNLQTQQQISQHFDKTRQFIIELIKKMNQFNQTPRMSSIIEGVSQQNSLFESTWLSNVTEQIDKQMISQFEKTMRRKKQGQMNQVPWWMYLIIVFFVYDDIWFSQEDHPIIHYTLLVILLFFGTLFAVGQGRVIKQSVRILVQKLKEKVPFLR